jgi:hypothetical protein
MDIIITVLILAFALIGFVLSAIFVVMVVANSGPTRSYPIYKESNSVWIDMHSQGESEEDGNA